MTWIRATPLYVWAICAFFALLQPLTHVAILHCAPAGVESTGLQKPDSVIYLHAMRMFDTGFYSPYATCQSPFGDRSVRLYAVPFYVLYGIAGSVASMVRMGEFVALGWANGLCGAAYLLAAYHFMRAVMPQRAGLAFVLYAFAGGVGGAVYLAAAALGVAGDAPFAKWFYRFAYYELVEGSNLAPYLMMPRLYYTLPLALGFAGVTTYIAAWRMRCRAHAGFAWLMLFVCTLLNARFGPPLLGVVAFYLVQNEDRAVRKALAAAVPLVAGMACATAYMAISPVFFSNYAEIVRQGMWFSSFLATALPLLLLAGPVVLRDVRATDGVQRVLCYGGLGFLALFAPLFVAHQAYYGTLVTGADHAAAVRMSDPALLGVVAGAAIAARRRPRGPLPAHAWVIAWAIVYTVLALAAFGQGWFLRFSPQRLLPFLGIPLSLLAAECVARMLPGRRGAAIVAGAGAVACGLCSLGVSTLVFQGPLGMKPGLASDLGMNTAYMPRADAACLESLGDGVVAAPRPYNDILSLREGVKVLGGFGAAGLSDQASALLDSEVQHFFAPGAPGADREEFLRRWCVSYVFLPSNGPARDALRREFDETAGLDPVAEAEGAVLYAVRQAQ